VIVASSVALPEVPPVIKATLFASFMGIPLTSLSAARKGRIVAGFSEGYREGVGGIVTPP
jgi:hypothetical protein